VEVAGLRRQRRSPETTPPARRQPTRVRPVNGGGRSEVLVLVTGRAPPTRRRGDLEEEEKPRKEQVGLAWQHGAPTGARRWRKASKATASIPSRSTRKGVSVGSRRNARGAADASDRVTAVDGRCSSRGGRAGEEDSRSGNRFHDPKRGEPQGRLQGATDLRADARRKPSRWRETTRTERDSGAGRSRTDGGFGHPEWTRGGDVGGGAEGRSRAGNRPWPANPTRGGRVYPARATGGL
jgi:hypothetical protein